MIEKFFETCAIDMVPVLLVRYRAQPKADDLFPPFRTLITAQPKYLNYAQIWDIRGWSGMDFKGQWVEQVQWNQAFRRAHGMESDNLLPLVLLMDNVPHLTKSITRSAGYVIAPMFIGLNIESAWAIIAPEVPMPQTARDFLNGN